MTNLTAAPPARLFTTFGTALYVDGSGVLRNGPIEGSPANLVLAAVGGASGALRSGSLMHGAGDSLEPIVCAAEQCLALSAVEGGGKSSGVITLELASLERGLIALKADGRFLCATPAGQVTLSREVCSTWECFLASEAWCSASDQDALPVSSAPQTQFSVRAIKNFALAPSARVSMNCRSRSAKVLICARPGPQRGRLYYDLAKQLHRRGYIVDVLDANELNIPRSAAIIEYYDFFLAPADRVSWLIDDHAVPAEKMIVLAFDEADVSLLKRQKGDGIFDRLAGYGAVSHVAYCASMLQGVSRPPRLLPVGVDCAEFYAEAPPKLESVGYASAMSVIRSGVEVRRGHLAEAAAAAAGLPFKVAGAPETPPSIHDMPGFFASVDAVVMSSLSEVGPLTVMGSAAAGRLVIGTPVADFPLKAYRGAGIIAPIEPETFVAFTAATLQHYKDHPADFVFKCLAVQEAARQFDWKHCIDDWVDFIGAA